MSTFSVVTSLSSTIIPSFTLSGAGSRNLTLKKLIPTNSTNSTIVGQNITITLINLLNPSSTKSIGSFSIKTYYN